MEELRALWNNLQAAESNLVSAGVGRVPERRESFFAALPLARTDFALLVRLRSGFDPHHLTASAYHTRYPFSPVETIEASLRRLAAAGWLDPTGESAYAVSDQTRELMRPYFAFIYDGIDGLTLQSVPDADLATLLEMDARIVRAVQEADPPYPRPVLSHRLRGFQPDYERPALSHHWQYTWTLIAAHEDAEESVRQERDVDPLLWFTRRQLASSRFDTAGPADLAHVATRYAPLEDAEAQCAAALAALQEAGWAEKQGGQYRLTPAGRERYDRDEEEIDRLFFLTWPPLSASERARLLDVTTRLNAALQQHHS